MDKEIEGKFNRAAGVWGGSSREENSTFRAVCRRVGMDGAEREGFHRWLHSNHGIDGQTTDLKFNELLEYAEEFMDI